MSLRKTALSLIGGLILAGCSSATKVEEPRADPYVPNPVRIESVEQANPREELVAMPLESVRVPAEAKPEEKAKEDPFIKGYFLTSTLKSKYVLFSGGGLLNKNPVVQSIFGVNTKYGTIDLWTNVDVKSAKFTEVDPEITIPFPLGTDYLKGSFYAAYFHFPQKDIGDLVMLAPTISSDNIPVDLSLTAYQLFGEDSRNGQMFVGKVGKSFDLGELVKILSGLKIEASQELGVGHKYYSDKSGFAYTDTKLGLSYPLSERLSVSAFGQYNVPFEKFEDEKYKGFHGGLGFNLDF